MVITTTTKTTERDIKKEKYNIMEIQEIEYIFNKKFAEEWVQATPNSLSI